MLAKLIFYFFSLLTQFNLHPRDRIAEHRVLDSYDYTKLKNFKKEDRYIFYYLVLMSMDYTKTESFMCILDLYYL